MDYRGLRKVNAILIFLIAAAVIMHFGAVVLIPLAFAAFLAFLLTPVSNWMERRGAGRGASAALSTIIVFVAISGLLTLMAIQLRGLTGELPAMEERLTELIEEVRSKLPIGNDGGSVNGIGGSSEELMGSIRSGVTGFFESSLTITIEFLLVLVYLFLMLLNRHHYARFLMMYTENDDKANTREVIGQAAQVAHQYLWGRLQVMTLLGIAYIITFLAFDVPYAILLTIFGTLITIIPYIGPFVSGSAPILVLLISGRDLDTVLIFAVFIAVIQLVESYVLEPLLMAKAVHLSPLTVIISVVVGGAIWGVAGMILLVPMFAIAKIFFDHVDSLKPIGYLFGQEKKGRSSKTTS